MTEAEVRATIIGRTLHLHDGDDQNDFPVRATCALGVKTIVLIEVAGLHGDYDLPADADDAAVLASLDLSGFVPDPDDVVVNDGPIIAEELDAAGVDDDRSIPVTILAVTEDGRIEWWAEPADEPLAGEVYREIWVEAGRLRAATWSGRQVAFDADTGRVVARRTPR